MEITTLKKVASAFKDNYQKYSILIIDNLLDDNFLDKSLDHAKKDILSTLINIYIYIYIYIYIINLIGLKLILC